MFKHALTQDVAYASLLVQRRRELHGLVGRAIEELYADRLPEHYEMLAHHFSQAEDWQRALDYLLKAAEKADAGVRPAPGARALRRGARGRATGSAIACPPATLIGHPSRARRPLLRRRRVRAVARGGRGARGPRPADRRSCPRRPARWCRSPRRCSGPRTSRRALERVREAIEIAEAVGAQAPLGGGLFIRGYLHAVSGRLDVAEADFGRALEIGRARGRSQSPGARPASPGAAAGAGKGQYRRQPGAGQRGSPDRARASARRPAPPVSLESGAGLHELGDYDRALAALDEGLALAEKIGDDAYIPRYLNTLGWLRIDCGDFARGIAAVASDRTRSRSAHRAPATAPAPSGAPSSATTRPRPSWRRAISPRPPRRWTRRITSSSIRRRRAG